MPHKLAIDFGTTNTILARWDEEKRAPEFLSLPGLSMRGAAYPQIPSLLYVHDGRKSQVTLGQMVIDRGLDQLRDHRLFRNFKHGMLSTSAVALVPGKSTGRILEGKPWGDRQASQRFLQGLMHALPLPKDDIDQWVVSAPILSFEGYTSWLAEALPGVSPEAIHIVDEPTAAALGYAVREPGALVLVFDFGGGTLDLSLVQLPESHKKSSSSLASIIGASGKRPSARVIAKSGLALGGSDVDRWLSVEVQKLARVTPGMPGDDESPLLAACEQAKIRLSSQEETSITFQAGGQEYRVPIDRSRLEAVFQENGFFSRIQEQLDRILRIAQRQGIYQEDIQHVLMVGGMSLVPSVQSVLARYFSQASIKVEKPFTAVVEGALQLAAGFGLDDYLEHSYGLRLYDVQHRRCYYDEIIPFGSPYPSEIPVKVRLGASHRTQAWVEFIAGEIASEPVTTLDVKYENGQAVFVVQPQSGSQLVHSLVPPGTEPVCVPLVPPGQPGTERLEASFRVDPHRQLRLSVLDLQTGLELLHNLPLGALGKRSSESDPDQNIALEPDQVVNGSEPALPFQPAGDAARRLSVRGLAASLGVLSPDGLSPAAAAQALRSPDPYIRFTAAGLLSRRTDREARLVLKETLNHGAAPQRASVAFHLSNLSWFSAEPLLRQALEDPDLRVRESAVYALCRTHRLEAFQILVGFLSGQPDSLKLVAAWALGLDPDPRSLPVLDIILTARDVETRVKALEVLGATGSPQAIPVAWREIESPDLEVSYAATLSLIELVRESCLAGLAFRIQQASGEARASLLRGLFHATNYLFIDLGTGAHCRPVLQALQASLEDDHAEARDWAARILAWMHSSEETASLLERAYLHEQHLDTRLQMLHAAVQLMSPAASDILQDALRSPALPLREAAVYFSKQQGNR